jgi:glutamate N-acetyltransferase/amino-acid N-acetyltransferase
MIHPDMATMLCFITTDADVELAFLRKCIKDAVDVSFNMLSIDGDTSTNDSVIILSNGAAGGSLIKEGSKAGKIFQTALRQVCMTLAMEIARDGEGATKLIEVTVEGATNLAEAKKAAKAVVSSSLVKSAIHGSDPNWGRIMATIGRSGADVNESIVDLHINNVCIMESGHPVPFFKNSIVAALSGPKISIRINLYLGDGTATAWGCDLSEEYVTFNSAYVT